MFLFRKAAWVCAAAVVASGAAGCGAAAPSKDGATPTTSNAAVATTTPAPSGDAGPISWAIYRATTSLDPITSLDAPENAIVDSLCEALLRQQPDLSIAPGLAESAEYTTPKTLVLTLRAGVKFWDGSPLTTADVVYSLQRAASVKAGSYYAALFDRVASIATTGPREVTLRLRQPDYWLRGQLSAMPGIVISKAFAERQGKKYGTPGGGVMCTGPFTLKSWKSGGDVVIERNPAYWDATNRASVSRITFTPVSSDPNLTAALGNGDIDGTYNPVLSTYAQMKTNPAVTVTSGPSLSTDALAVARLDGPLGDVRVRRALSLAIDRQTYIDNAYHGQALLPRTSTNPGTWSYARSVFESTSGKEPELRQDLDKAKALVKEAGATGKTVVMATTPVLPSIVAAGNVVTTAAKEIGLELKLKTFSIDTYATVFVDPKARAGIDLIATLNNPNYGDPGPFLALYTSPEGGQDYSGWKSPAVTRLLESARETADDAERARKTAQADKLVTEQLPWIPMAQPFNVLYMSKDITGASPTYQYLNGPWASAIGAAAR